MDDVQELCERKHRREMKIIENEAKAARLAAVVEMIERDRINPYKDWDQHYVHRLAEMLKGERDVPKI